MSHTILLVDANETTTAFLADQLAADGYEPAVAQPAVIIATVGAVVETGPGSVSLDAALGRERTGAGWALAAVAAGAAGSTLLLRDWERPAPAEEAPAAEAPAEAAPAREHANA